MNTEQHCQTRNVSIILLTTLETKYVGMRFFFPSKLGLMEKQIENNFTVTSYKRSFEPTDPTSSSKRSNTHFCRCTYLPFCLPYKSKSLSYWYPGIVRCVHSPRATEVHVTNVIPSQEDQREQHGDALEMNFVTNCQINTLEKVSSPARSFVHSLPQLWIID